MQSYFSSGRLWPLLFNSSTLNFSSPGTISAGLASFHCPVSKEKPRILISGGLVQFDLLISSGQDHCASKNCLDWIKLTQDCARVRQELVMQRGIGSSKKINAFKKQNKKSTKGFLKDGKTEIKPHTHTKPVNNIKTSNKTH